MSIALERTSYIETILMNSLYPALIDKIGKKVGTFKKNILHNDTDRKELKQKVVAQLLPKYIDAIKEISNENLFKLSTIIAPQQSIVFRMSYECVDDPQEIYELLLLFREKTSKITLDFSSLK